MREPMRIRRSVLLAVPLVALALSGCHRDQAQKDPAKADVAQGADVPGKGVDRSHAGQAMPTAEIYNVDDDPATLGGGAGKPTLVNMWATWCAPCVKELPTLDALSSRPGAPKVIAVSQDIGNRSSIDAFLESHGISHLEVWRDPKMAFSAALGVQVMPTTIYYDSSGHEVWRYVGDLDWTSNEAAKLLAEAGAAAKG